MQAIIMAAGRGSRIKQFTEDKPKAFLEINGVKLIEYNISLLRDKGIERIIIVTGYKAECFEELLGYDKNIKLIYNPFYEMMNVLGSFFIGQEYLPSDEDIIYLHADTICSPEILDKLIAKEADIVLPVEFKLCDAEAMKVVICDGRVEKISKEILCNEADGEFIGIAKLSKNVLEDIKQNVTILLKKKQFNNYFESAIQLIIDQGLYNIVTIPTDGLFWSEIDFLADYENAISKIPNSLVEIAHKGRN